MAPFLKYFQVMIRLLHDNLNIACRIEAKCDIGQELIISA